MQNNTDKKIVYLANPRGFCAGVERAIEIVERALKKFGPPVYVRHEIVHNKYVVNFLKEKGAVFVEEVSEIPLNAVTIFSAHGVSKKVEDDSGLRKLEVIDATCPLVKKVHYQVLRNEEKGDRVILIGHSNHPEVEGTSGRSKQGIYLVESEEDVERLNFAEDENLSYITQTTLSVDDTKNIISKLRSKYPNIQGPKSQDICYATQNRQDAVKEMVKEDIDVLLVLGAPNSSNSNRLKDIGSKNAIPSYLVQRARDFDLSLLKDFQKIGVTAGASAPEILVVELIDLLKTKFAIEVKDLTVRDENVVFNIPKILQE